LRENLAELWRFRNLLWQLVRRDLKVRYKNSRFGFVWSIMPPLMQVAVITYAFRYATPYAENFNNYSAYVLVAIIPWTYFSSALMDASMSILMMYALVKKVYLPREVIPLAAAISNFIHFLLSWLVFAIYWWGVRRLIGSPTPFLWTTLLLPYLFLVQFMLVTGLCLLVAALNVFYEDVKYIVSVLLGLGLFVLPIMYVVEQVQVSGWVSMALYHLNPLSVLISAYRKVLLEPPPMSALPQDAVYPPLDYGSLLYTGILSLLVLILSYAYFNRRKWQFAERP
jgi:ABC-type polysaccharide/polyol phosphate export permease